jgi:hypothetical protein
MPNSNIISDREIPDAFVFCSSLTLTRKLNEKFEYNSSFKITDPSRFAELIFTKLTERHDIVGYLTGKVKYATKERNITNQNKSFGLDDISQAFHEYCFKKPLSFKSEQEYRMVFLLGNETAIQPIEITCLELLKCCVFN